MSFDSNIQKFIVPIDTHRLLREINPYVQIHADGDKYTRALKAELDSVIAEKLGGVTLTPDMSKEDLEQVIFSGIFPVYNTIRDLIWKSATFDNMQHQRSDFYTYMSGFSDQFGEVEQTSIIHHLNLGTTDQPVYIVAFYFPDREDNQFVFGMTGSKKWVNGILNSQDKLTENYKQLAFLHKIKTDLEKNERVKRVPDYIDNLDAMATLYTREDLPDIEKEMARISKLTQLRLYLVNRQAVVLAKDEQDAKKMAQG